MTDLLLTFYGDDFTGSTDAMESLVMGGVPCVLFLEPPEPDFVAQHFPDVRAVGVAGVSRSMTPEQMDGELPPKFARLKALNAPVNHYKICSTFDSSPAIGSIGHATELGVRVFAPKVVPIMVGAPALKRYVVFGNLFATVSDHTYRLDRHPTMSRHPMTPMDEADLRLHLGRQTPRRIGLIDVLTLAQSNDAIAARFQALVAEGCEIVLFDTLDEAHVVKIGRLIWSLAGEQRVFTVASSGVEYALSAYWRSVGMVQPPAPLPSPGPVEQLIVVSGSASPVTAGQMERAIAGGMEPIRLDGPGLVDPAMADDTRLKTIQDALEALGRGRSVILYSASGPDDPAIQATRNRLDALGLDAQTVGSRLGAQQGQILRTLLEATGLRRVCVAGGDTSGHAASQLDIYALEVLMPIAPGSPLCRARSRNPFFDGLEIALKGGQLGHPDYFNSIRRGAV